MARTIQSPGVQINEVDLSLRAVGAPPTTVFVSGFASKGPTSEPLLIGSLSEFEQVYGVPTNAAERYFYHTAKAIFQSTANVMVYRLPYGEGRGLDNSDNFSALVYPALSYVDGVTSTNLNLGVSGTYFFGRPTHVKLTEEQYLSIVRGDAFAWSTVGTTSDFTALADLGKAGLIILNKSQSTINTKYEGYYLGVIDNTNLNPATPYDDVNRVLSINTSAAFIENYVQLPEPRLNFPLSAASNGLEGSVSEVLENLATYDISTSKYDDTISLGVFKLRQSVFSPETIALDYILEEGYVGSLDSTREVQNQNGGDPVSFFLDNINVNSKNIITLTNPYISKRTTNQSWANDNGIPTKKARFLCSPRLQPIEGDTNTVNLSGYRSTIGISAGSFATSPTLSSTYANGVTVDSIVSVPDYTSIVSFSASLDSRFENTSKPWYIPGTYETRVGAPSAVYQQFLNVLGGADALFALGDYSSQNLTTQIIGNVPAKVELMLDKVENSEIYPLSLTVEGGLGTIYANSLNPATTGYFDDSVPFTSRVNALTAQNPTTIPQMAQDYLAAVNPFVAFASLRRKDHMFIADPLTNIFIQGQNLKTLDDPTKNFSQHIYWPLRNQFSTINTSYVSIYANVAKVADTAASRQVWVPFSGFAAAAMANTDSNTQPWFAPAGFTRGIVTGVTDLGLYPKQTQRDALYKISLNPVVYFPNEGFVIFGQKTSQKTPSAFDRINVRRLFLDLEVKTRDTVRFFVFEPNSLFTRTQIKNVLTPIFDLAKNTQGVYDYLIICDERNNTPSVIDDNSLVVDIYLKPVRSAEFILVNFYATRTGTNFQEIVA
jgi:hypothetical protein